MKLSIAMFFLFIFLGIAEVSINPVNAFVLFVIALVYFRGHQKGKSYVYTASLIAVVFAIISILALIASYIDCMILNETYEWELEFGLAGIIALPLLWKIKP